MLLLTAVALGLAWAFRAVLVTSDPWHYAQAALDLGGHTWIPSGLTRWGIILPLVGVGAVFGPTLPTFYAFAFLAPWGLMLWVLWRIAKAWRGRRRKSA